MRRINRKNFFLEAILASLVPAGINLLFPDNPAFITVYFMPYIVCALFFAVFGGVLSGFISFSASAALAVGVLPLCVPLLYAELSAGELWRSMYPGIFIGFAPGVLLTYLFGSIHDRYVRENDLLRERFKKQVKRSYRSSVMIKSLIKTNEELEERLSRQQESIMALFNQVKKIDTVSVETVLDVLLETVNIFTRAGSASIWKYIPVHGTMELASARGWEAEKGTETVIPVDSTIEGWVVRNNQYFSVRMLLQYDNLRRLYNDRNIITFPIQVENHIWGVLNIEELPFVKYNLYTERLLFIIISLIEPSLHKAVEYNAIMQREEVDGLTGLPLFTSFYNVLQKELERKQIEQGKISIIVLDIVNYPDIIAEHDEAKVKGELIPQIIQAIYQATENQGQGFQFKMDNQFGFIFPNLDYDGASLYCLEILERMNSFDVSLEDRKLQLEVIIGFSAFAGNENADDMIDRAENLLEMQKV